ncbi:uncharacterized protein LOC100901288 [Galendromus occidentalis]|uniref:Uncharacterized protein LOC100901288 n=1 Tax=Galendromus occidentalis TaxID=34638 RepID=A0AAJ6VUW8_9ACAR|nr:uncharacterized protein LOC100901288 [Galendromus occidentalis]
MVLVDAPEAERIEASIMAEEVMGGGSAANTAVIARRMGASVAYLGKVASDDAGIGYANELRSQGINYASQPVEDSPTPTARCIILVTPDGQRTMHTFLGVSTEFSVNDLDTALIASSSIVYMEGYLFDKAPAQDAFVQAASMAHEAGRKVAVTLSDAFCVNRHRDAFLALIRGHIDIVFANEAEICALYQTSDFDHAIAQVAEDTALTVVTRAENGAVIVEGKNVTVVPTASVNVVDSTGAGDAFAGGFLALYARNQPLVACAKAGNQAASSVITRMGARPDASFPNFAMAEC